MTEPRTHSFDWALWFQWMMATTVAWVLGRFLLPNLAYVAIGIALGVLQWFVLQKWIRDAWRWIPVTMLGWWLGTVIILLLVPTGMDFLAGVVTGTILGAAQWLVLRREVHWSGWWILINIVAWTTGYALLPGVLLTGVIAGLITATCMGLLLLYPKPVISQDH
jgi:hypothetical protein